MASQDVASSGSPAAPYRVAYLSAPTINERGERLYAEGKYAEAKPLFEKALEIRHRLLTDDHPETVESYNNLAANFNTQGKYTAAQRLYEKARRSAGACSPKTTH